MWYLLDKNVKWNKVMADSVMNCYLTSFYNMKKINDK